MGRSLSSTAGALGALISASGGYGLPGQLPAFGLGRFTPIVRSQNFVVPANVTSLRVRVLAGGAGYTAPGGATSFGAYMSATGGGAASGAVPGLGGVGVGGDFQAKGGDGGAEFRGGGGASGSELGDGGAGGKGGATGGGGGGVGGHKGGDGHALADRLGGAGGSAFGPGDDAPDTVASSTSAWTGPVTIGGSDITGRIGGYHNPGAYHLPHVLFAFIGGGGTNSSAGAGRVGGSGAGGSGASSAPARTGGLGGVCGGGGGGMSNVAGSGEGGVGGVAYDEHLAAGTGSSSGGLARIGGGAGGDQGRAGGGGGGYARGVIEVEPGQIIPVTVGLPGPWSTGQSAGLVIVEW